ncbi:MAG: hypothetical protein H0T12_04730 [Actinobacteria bacterium]|nr:hypothetical protein [Actinomycetota bacterium]
MPVVAVLALPPSALGSYAASRRSSFVGSGYLASPEDVASGDLSLTDIAGALQSQGGERALARRAGSQVSLVGFVTREAGMPADEFVLTRFLVSFCVADALSVQVRVVGAPPGLEDRPVGARRRRPLPARKRGVGRRVTGGSR